MNIWRYCHVISFYQVARGERGLREIDGVGAPLNFVGGTRRRLLRGVIEGDSAETPSRVPRAPLTREEIMDRIQCRYENDEISAFRLLATKGSAPCTLCVEW